MSSNELNPNENVDRANETSSELNNNSQAELGHTSNTEANANNQQTESNNTDSSGVHRIEDLLANPANVQIDLAEFFQFEESNDDEYEDEFLDEDDDEEEEEEEQEEEEDEEMYEEEEEQYENMEKPNDVNYDTNLPSSHNYLGQNFQDVSSSYLNLESQLSVPLLPMPGGYHGENGNHTQLIPGQVMPMYFYSPVHIQIIRRRMNEGNPIVGFALNPNIFLAVNSNESQPNEFQQVLDRSDDLKFGILAEILSISFQDSNNQQQLSNSLLDLIGGIILKVKGRDRFEIQTLTKEVNSTYIANVKILPELRFKLNPLFKCLPVQMEYSCQAYLSEVPKDNSRSLQSKIEYFNTSHMPAWMLRKYDCNYIMNVIKKELLSGFGLVCNQDADKDPQIFSSWLLNNFPFDNKMRSHSLKISCLNQRLLYIHSLLKQFSEIVCTNCGAPLCSKVDIFSISKQGYMAPFLNPGGVIHETLTVYKIKNCSMVRMPPCAQHSWFPGYGWQICNCANCGNHIGWKFTSMSSNLKPEKFWGLTRKSIRYESSNSSS